LKLRISPWGIPPLLLLLCSSLSVLFLPLALIFFPPAASPFSDPILISTGSLPLSPLHGHWRRARRRLGSGAARAGSRVAAAQADARQAVAARGSGGSWRAEAERAAPGARRVGGARAGAAGAGRLGALARASGVWSAERLKPRELAGPGEHARRAPEPVARRRRVARAREARSGAGGGSTRQQAAAWNRRARAALRAARVSAGRGGLT
jgi:hypothetical protein